MLISINTETYISDLQREIESADWFTLLSKANVKSSEGKNYCVVVGEIND